MKILFDHCRLWEDTECKLGLTWNKFSPVVGSKLSGSGGFYVSFYLVRWYASVTWVKNYEAYKARRDHRSWKKVALV